MQAKKSTHQEYQKQINIIVNHINNHLNEEMKLSVLARDIKFISISFSQNNTGISGRANRCLHYALTC